MFLHQNFMCKKFVYKKFIYIKISCRKFNKKSFIPMKNYELVLMQVCKWTGDTSMWVVQCMVCQTRVLESCKWAQKL